MCSILDQQPHHHRFAILCWHGGDTHIYRTAFDRKAKSTILRQTFFRNIQTRHDLETHHQRSGNLDIRLRLKMHHTINPESDQQLIVLWFNVYIRGTHLYRIFKNGLQQLDHGRIVYAQVNAHQASKVGIAVGQILLQLQG